MKNKIKHIIYLILLSSVVIYIFYSWNYSYKDIKTYKKIKRHSFIYDKIDLDKSNEFHFIISEKQWKYKEELHGELLVILFGFNAEDKYINEDKDIEIEFKAYSKNNDRVYDRVILNEYYPSKSVSLKELDYRGGISIDGIKEFGRIYSIGLLNNFAFEDIEVKLNFKGNYDKLKGSSPVIAVTGYNALNTGYGAYLGKKVYDILTFLIFFVLTVFFIREIYFFFKKIKHKES